MPGALPMDDLSARRARARRTALWLGAIAATVFIGFIALNVVLK